MKKNFLVKNQVLNDKIISLESTLADYESLKRKMDDLYVYLEKFTNGIINFEKNLGAQKHAFDKRRKQRKEMRTE